MEDYKIYLKVKEAIEAVNEYKKMLDGGETGNWNKEINEGLIELNQKRHMLASSGQTCSCCGGSGRAN